MNMWQHIIYLTGFLNFYLGCCHNFNPLQIYTLFFSKQTFYRIFLLQHLLHLPNSIVIAYQLQHRITGTLTGLITLVEMHGQVKHRCRYTTPQPLDCIKGIP